MNPPCHPHDLSGYRRWPWFLALVLSALLAGCAAPAPQGTAPVSPTTATGPALPQPFIPQGPLSEIGTGQLGSPPVSALSAPVDIWDRIRRSFAMPELDTDLVRDREKWYASRPDYIQRMTERSARYLFHIVEEIERRELPMELALLPFIESAFNPQAVSSARAAGMWQFMPATGQSFDLKQNVFRDDRRDVLASTRAALDYLEQLHARFGDWHLALAAYNWGQGNVGRAITRNQKAGLPATYTELTMPLETRMYVPKLQAVKNIVARPEHFNLKLPDIGNHPFFDTVTIERDIDVSLIARLSEVDERDFRALNPSIKLPLVMAAGTPNILLPWDNAAIFERRLKDHNGPLASWTAWVVPATMTVAEVARRVGVSESELRSLNNIPPRMQVRAGSSVLVPRTSAVDRDVPVHVADNGHLSLQPDASSTRRTIVRARKGETLTRLARRHGLDPVAVAGWNGLGVNAALAAGQRITLLLPTRGPAASAKAKAPTTTQRKQATAKKPPKAATKNTAKRQTPSNTRVAGKQR